jgi:HEAT repeat protein
MNQLVNLFHSLTPEEKIFIWIAMACVVGAFLFILFLLISRSVKNSHEVEAQFYRGKFQESINELVFADDDASWVTQLKKLKGITGQSAAGKQALIDQMIALKKSLSGMAVENLERAYKELSLHEHSLRKLMHGSWSTQVAGIYELAEMNYPEASHVIKPFLLHANYALRDEAFMALLKLDQDSSFSFLDDYKASVSFWMRMRIHHHLSHIDKRKLPDFTKWFSNNNVDVALFSISMARHFRQLAAVPALILLLRDSDKRKVSLAVSTLGDLETYEHADELVNLIDFYWSDSKLSRRIALSLGKLSNTENQWNGLTKYLKHPDYTVRYETARAIHEAGKPLSNLAPGLEVLTRHVQEPLLQTS